MPVPESFAEDVAAEYAEDILIADDLLAEISKADRSATYAEFAYFAKLGWDENEVRSQLRRTHSRLRFQAIAGGPNDRKAGKAEATRTANVLADQGPKLEAEIEKLEKKLRQLQQAAKLAQQRQEDQEDAVRKLRELIPSHIRDKYNFDKRALSVSVRRPLLDAKTRLQQLELLTNPDRHATPRDYIEAIRSQPGAVDEIPTRGYTQRQLSAAYPAILAEWKAELAELEPQVKAMERDYEQKKAAIDRTLEFYSDPATQDVD